MASDGGRPGLFDDVFDDDFESEAGSEDPESTSSDTEDLEGPAEAETPAGTEDGPGAGEAESDTGGGPPRVKRSTGRRTALRRRRRRRRFLRGVLLTLLTVVVSVGIVVLAANLDFSSAPEPQATEPADDTTLPAGDVDQQPTLVLATFDETAPTPEADLIVVLAYDRTTGEGTVLFVPSSTVADVPGYGLLPVGSSFAYGQSGLLEATLDNLLGIDLDGVAAVSQQGWASLLTRSGGFTVDIDERLVEPQADGSAVTRFEPGEQFLDGPRLAELLTFRQPGETELERFPRAQRVIEPLLVLLAEDQEAFDAVFSDGAPMLDTAMETSDVTELFALAAEAAATGNLVSRTLPVTPVSSGEQGSYRIDTERADRLIEERFGASVPEGATTEGRRLQILNGNGVPGIGQEVSQLLVPDGFRVVLTGNADSFSHEETRIVVYDDDPDQLALAERIRELLGVGRVELSGTPQSVVDITIVVGRDFASS